MTPEDLAENPAEDVADPSLDGRRILIAGCGYVGRRLAELLVDRGAEVWGLKRSPTDLPSGVRGLAGDVTEPGSLDLPEQLDGVVYAVSPDDRSADAYRAAYVDGPANVRSRLDAASRASRFILVSSTGVYGYRDGRVVDETTPPRPADETGQVILEAETTLLDGHPNAVVLRLGGIYGPGREWTVRKVESGDVDCPPPGVYTNRIHREDAAGAIVHLLTLGQPSSLYLGVDRESPELREIYRWIADRLGLPDPCAGDGTDADEPPGRRGTNKRCSGERLVASGYRFRFSTFREGYASLLDVPS